MFLTNTANYLTERILLAESITDNLAELQQLEKVAEPGFLKSYLDDLVPHLVNFAFRAVLAVVIYFIGKKITGWLRRLLRRALERSGVDEGVKQFLDSCAKITLYLILAMAVINELGMETTSIVAVLGSAGLALGLALQGSLSNFAGGVLILLFKPFKVGDYIMEDTHGNEGTVAEIMIFYTKLSTPDNRTVVIPNGTLANASLTNVTQQDRRRVDVYVGVSYDTDIRRAKSFCQKFFCQNRPGWKKRTGRCSWMNWETAASGWAAGSGWRLLITGR